MLNLLKTTRLIVSSLVIMLLALCVIMMQVNTSYAQPIGVRTAMFNNTVRPTWQWNFAKTNALPSDDSVTVNSPNLNGLVTDSTGALTYKGNNLIRSGATMSTQTTDVNLGTQNNYLLCFSGAGTVTLTGAYAGGPYSSGVTKFTPSSAAALTMTVSGSVTNASLSAVTYETQCRPQDQVYKSIDYFGPAFDYNKGLRVWGSMSNYAWASNAPATTWTKSANTTATNNYTGTYATLSPDGTADQGRVQGTANPWSLYQNSPTAAGNTASIISAYVKSNTGNDQKFRLFLNGGTASNDITATTSWNRVQFSGTHTNGQTFGLMQDVAGDTADIQVYCLQMSAYYLASCIPTGASSGVSTSSDNVKIPNLAAVGGFSATNESVVVEYGGLPTLDQNVIIAEYNSTAYFNSLGLQKNVTCSTYGHSFTLGNYNGNSTCITGPSSGNDGGVHRAAFSWGGTALNLAVDGVGYTPDVWRTISPTNFHLGSRTDANDYYINGYIHGLSFYYNKTLTQSQINAKSVVGSPY